MPIRNEKFFCFFGPNTTTAPQESCRYLPGTRRPLRARDTRQSGETSMKFAAYTDEGIFGIGDTEAEARTAGVAEMESLEASAEELAQIKIIPIKDDLVAALSALDNGGPEVNFDVENGILVLAEAGDEDDGEAAA